MAWTRGKAQRGRTRNQRAPGARGKAAGALTAATGALKDMAIESAKDGVKNVSEKVGKAAGAGMAVAATAVVDAAGYHPSPLIAVGAAYAGVKVGGLVGRAMNAGLDRVTKGGGGPIATVMAELSAVLQLLEEVGKGIAQVIDSVNKAQAHYQQVSKGANNNLLESATKKCRRAPRHFTEGMDEIEDAKGIVGKHLVAVATAGKA
jgi:hypothetical protein